MKLIFKHILFTLLLVFAINTAFAQGDKKDKIDALRAAFISKKVSFTAAESQAFWPLYNEMNDKLDAVRKTFRLQYNAKTNYDFATDKEAEAYLAAELNVKQKEYELYKEYYDKFKKILPVKKVSAVRRAEEDFKKELIKIVKEN
ncbi:MAG: hypothetical protein IPP64_17335 [Bacteroidetes bacterium]|nr:hypothetical protein [Bacteroidota bacterium]